MNLEKLDFDNAREAANEIKKRAKTKALNEMGFKDEEIAKDEKDDLYVTAEHYQAASDDHSENEKSPNVKKEEGSVENEGSLKEQIIENAKKFVRHWNEWHEISGLRNDVYGRGGWEPEPQTRLVLPKNGMCLYGKEGKKEGNPVAFFDSSFGYNRFNKNKCIVFLPKNAPLYKEVLVILDELEKKDGLGRKMYRGKPTDGYIEFWQDNNNDSASLYRVHFDWNIEATEVESLGRNMPLNTEKVIEKQFVLDIDNPAVNEVATYERIDVSDGSPIYKQPGRKEVIPHKLLGFETSISDWKNLFFVNHGPDEDMRVFLTFDDKGEKTQQAYLKWKDAPEWWKRMYEKKYPVCECNRCRFNIEKHTECEDCKWEKALEEDKSGNVLDHYKSGKLEIEEDGYYSFWAKRKIDESAGESKEDYLNYSDLEVGMHIEKVDMQKEVTLDISIPFEYEGRDFPPNVKIRRLKHKDTASREDKRLEENEFAWELLKSCKESDYFIEDVTSNVMTFLSFLTKRDKDFEKGKLELEIVDGSGSDGGGNMYFDVKVGEKSSIRMFGKYGDEWEATSELIKSLKKGAFPYKLIHKDKKIPIGSEVVITERKFGLSSWKGEPNTPKPEGDGWEKLEDMQFSEGSSGYGGGWWETAWVKIPRNNSIKK